MTSGPGRGEVKAGGPTGAAGKQASRGPWGRQPEGDLEGQAGRCGSKHQGHGQPPSRTVRGGWGARGRKGREGDWAPPLRPSDTGDLPTVPVAQPPSQPSAVKYFTLFTANAERAGSGHILQIRKRRPSEAQFLAERLLWGWMWLGQANLQSRTALPACQGSFLAGADVDVAGCFWLSLSLSSLSLGRRLLAGLPGEDRSV